MELLRNGCCFTPTADSVPAEFETIRLAGRLTEILKVRYQSFERASDHSRRSCRIAIPTGQWTYDCYFPRRADVGTNCVEPAIPPNLLTNRMKLPTVMEKKIEDGNGFTLIELPVV